MTRRGSYENAYRTFVVIRNIFKYAHSLDKLGDGRILAKLDTYRENVPKPKTSKHLYSELSEPQIAELLRRIEAYVQSCSLADHALSSLQARRALRRGMG